MEQITVNSIGQLVETSTKLEELRNQRIWFRGHYLAGWQLIPGAFRPDLNRGRANYERLLGIHFRLRAVARHPSCPNTDDFGSWMFLMQHFRLPTRLLDWTESPLVGAYFALWNDIDPQRGEPNDAEIFALAPNSLNKSQLPHGKLALIEDKELRHLIPNWLLSESDENEGSDVAAKGRAKVAAVLPAQVDQRVVAQQGVFTIHAPGVGIESLPRSEIFLTRIRIPAARRERIRRDLLAMGVRPMNLFPDLDHLSADLKNFEHVI